MYFTPSSSILEMKSGYFVYKKSNTISDLIKGVEPPSASFAKQ
jgi:hypothetical protein